MSDWQVGDLAVCVDDRFNPAYGETLLARGRTYTVVEVTYCTISNVLWHAGTGLVLAGVPCSGLHGFAAERFRKIRPDEREACEPEFVTLLNRIKRKVEA